MTDTRTPITPYRSRTPEEHDGFSQVLRAEWTKFRSVRGWTIGMAAAAIVTIAIGMLAASSGSQSPGAGISTDPTSHNYVPLGPNGEAVTDTFSFVHQTLAGDGSITVRLTSFIGLTEPPPKEIDPNGDGNGPVAPDPNAKPMPGVQPWAKAGIIVKDGTTQGSTYAAIMATGDHGVRMQDDYTNDTAGSPGTAAAISEASPTWLRLTRTGTRITGEESTDGEHWTTVDAPELSTLPATVEVGMFVASPRHDDVEQVLGGIRAMETFTIATATFDHVDLRAPGGTATGADAWRFDTLPADQDIDGVGARLGRGAGFEESAGVYTVRGFGNIAPALGEQIGVYLDRSLSGTFVGLIIVVVVAALFMTSEYRRGLIRTTLTASPRRGRVLAAKAIVIGGVSFVAASLGATIAMVVGRQLLIGQSKIQYPATLLTEGRVITGTAAMLAAAAVLALAVGTVLRRSAATVTVVFVLIVLPYLLAVSSVLPDDVSRWLLRVTPAAAFAIQQRIPQYPQVDSYCSMSQGCFPLAPFAGLAVLILYAVVALGLAFVLLRSRDA